jgi:ABC-type spermidine/putrescine transport system permease subunit II
MRVTGHILATFFKAIGRIILAAIVCGILGAGIVLLVSFVQTKGTGWPGFLAIVTAVAVGVLSLYAGGVTVLMREAVRALQEAAKDVEHNAGSAIKGAEAIAQQVEKHL